MEASPRLPRESSHAARDGRVRRQTLYVGRFRPGTQVRKKRIFSHFGDRRVALRSEEKQMVAAPGTAWGRRFACVARRWSRLRASRRQDCRDGFNDLVFVFDPERSEWHDVMRSQDAARAGAAIVPTGDNGGFVLIGGEVKPRVRTPRITRYVIPIPEYR